MRRPIGSQPGETNIEGLIADAEARQAARLALARIHDIQKARVSLLPNADRRTTGEPVVINSNPVKL